MENGGGLNGSSNSAISNTCCQFNENNSNILLKYRYKLGEVVGAGSFGTIYKSIDTCTNSIVACKRFRIPVSDTEGLPQNVIREIGLLKYLSNQPDSSLYLVKLLDVCIGKCNAMYDQLYFVMDYFPNDMFNYIYQQNKGICKNLEISIKVGCAVQYLHSQRIAHLDLKPQNILMDMDGNQVRLCDFGMSRIASTCIPSTRAIVTFAYRAPEVILSNTESSLPVVFVDEFKIDCWSLCVIIYELFTKKTLFAPCTTENNDLFYQYNMDCSEMEQLIHIFAVIGLPPKRDWPPYTFIDYETIKKEFENSHKNKSTWLEKKNLLPINELSDLFEKALTFDPVFRWSAYKITELLKNCSSNIA